MDIKALPLRYDAMAHVRIEEKYPQGALAAVAQRGKAGFDALCEIVQVLAKQAAAYAKITGNAEEQYEIPQSIATEIKLWQVPELKTSALDEITKGLASAEGHGLEEQHMLYNAAAHFDAQERFENGIFAEIGKPGVEGYLALCEVASMTMEQAELLRRAMGHDPSPIRTAEEIAVLMMPGQIWKIKQRVMETVIQGLAPEPPDEHEEIDEVLAEIEKKKETV